MKTKAAAATDSDPSTAGAGLMSGSAGRDPDTTGDAEALESG